MKPMHIQVPFQTWDGHTVNVDKGMLDILNRLRDLGLRSQYSCQKNISGAYVVVDAKSAKHFETLLQTIELSAASKRFATKFLDGPRQRTFTVGSHHRDWIHIDFGAHLRFKPKPNKAYFIVERSYQNAPHWLRTTYRWPSKMTPQVLQLLDELLSHTT